eukprot:2936555-Prymnesium_polylepis.1
MSRANAQCPLVMTLVRVCGRGCSACATRVHIGGTACMSTALGQHWGGVGAALQHSHTSLACAPCTHDYGDDRMCSCAQEQRDALATLRAMLLSAPCTIPFELEPLPCSPTRGSDHADGSPLAAGPARTAPAGAPSARAGASAAL